ncbi:MAG TPA: glutathione S-transferase family protein [Casimicrobiaceae bacterium]|nr:glutathione S-transferase family protein [Casimicrobiaceae bacterium]
MYTLYIANRNYSSWSLRGWLCAKLSGAPFKEVVEQLGGHGGPNLAYNRFSPSGLVPCLHDGDVVVWDSLAIAEYLAERHAGMWPKDGKARALARSMSAEMHSGFRDLRNDMTMCIRERVDVRPWSEGLVHNIDRVQALWTDARSRFGGSGQYLFGDFSIADAFFAPVGFRFQTYDVKPQGVAGDYLRALLAHPWLAEWQRMALAEKEIIEADEPRHIYREKLASLGRL